MAEQFVPAPGDVVAKDALAIPRARGVAKYLAGGPPYATLLECRHFGTTEVFEAVVFDVDVAVSQLRAFDVHPRERIAAVFDPADRLLPEILALRKTFPLVPHTNVRDFELPRSLCWSDEPFSALRLRWTPERFIEWVRDWFARTAEGTLHAEDQALEPIFLNYAGIVVLDPHALVATDEASYFFVGRVPNAGEKEFLRSCRRAREKPEGANVVLAAFTCDPRPHGVIRQTPMTLADVHAVGSEAGIDLLGALRRRLRDWESNEILQGAHLMLVLTFPKTRKEGTGIEASDRWAFLLDRNVRDLGAAIGVWGLVNGKRGMLLHDDEEKRGEDVAVRLYSPALAFSRDVAAVCNGARVEKTRVAVIGVGALGSQVVTNLVRSGFGQWWLIDSDIVLPHNLARHALLNADVGLHKAEALAATLNQMMDEDEPVANAVVEDVLLGHSATMNALASAEVVLDLSASVEVGRFLARDCNPAPRRVSAFLNPRGTDLVILAEDQEQSIPLDALEMQYYRAVIERDDLAGHLEPAVGQTRYSRSCRDVTSTLPQDAMALHAALASRVLRKRLSSPEALIAVFRFALETGEVHALRLAPERVEVAQVKGWTILADEGFTSRVRKLREAKLPCETGGVLLGAFDVDRRVAYVVSALPAPADSTERPVYFDRGAAGLKDEVAGLRARTGNMVEYVGEWHSHPPGHDCAASEMDRQVLMWQAERMADEGLPAIMLIVGDSGHIWYVG